MEQVFCGESQLMKVIRNYEAALKAVEKNPEEQALQAAFLNAQQQMDAAYAWQLESEAKSVLTQMGITDF